MGRGWLDVCIIYREWMTVGVIFCSMRNSDMGVGICALF